MIPFSCSSLNIKAIFGQNLARYLLYYTCISSYSVRGTWNEHKWFRVVFLTCSKGITCMSMRIIYEYVLYNLYKGPHWLPATFSSWMRRYWFYVKNYFPNFHQIFTFWDTLSRKYRFLQKSLSVCPSVFLSFCLSVRRLWTK